MARIIVYDRDLKSEIEEKIEAGWGVKLLYTIPGNRPCLLRKTLCSTSLFSKLMGKIVSSRRSKQKIEPFIAKHKLDKSEFLKDSFDSFNDFFIRKLKKEARPIAAAPVIMPADGRYLAYENFQATKQIIAKDSKFSLLELLGGDEKLAQTYLEGSVLIARLAPPDYHRFHFPVEGVPSAPIAMKGTFHSVNPIALKRNIRYLTQNKRSLVTIQTPNLGLVTCVAVGALFVGAIHYTYIPNQKVEKGEEMGYFSFGGSTLIVLFEPGRIQIGPDLLANTQKGIETFCKMGSSVIISSDGSSF